ncbi:MAG: SRPBCC family protein, partial [Anaerolineae bacterium]|nr:SRPBCC family protein [Gemmatimonadaceae bacterium]
MSAGTAGFSSDGSRGAHVLQRTQLISSPLPEVFEFFSEPRNLARITPPSLGFRIHGDPPAHMQEGARIEYRIRWSGLSLAWVSRIVSWRPGVGFQDVQEKGPYRSWVHTHSFEETEGGVTMHDRVEYTLPLGLLGRVANSLVVRRQLENIFEFR